MPSVKSNPFPMNQTKEKLLASAKELLKNGWSPGDIYKWIKEKADTEEDRAWISSQVFNKAKLTNTPKDQSEIIFKREVVNAQYLKKEAETSFGNLSVVSLGFLMLGLLLLVLSLLFEGHNYYHAVFCLVTGIGMFAILKLADIKFSNRALYLMIGLVIFILLELFSLGLPNVLIPNLGRFGDKQMVNIITIVNEVFPWIYYAIKVGLLVVPVKYFIQLKKLEALPQKIKQEIRYKL